MLLGSHINVMGLLVGTQNENRILGSYKAWVAILLFASVAGNAAEPFCMCPLSLCHRIWPVFSVPPFLSRPRNPGGQACPPNLGGVDF